MLFVISELDRLPPKADIIDGNARDVIFYLARPNSSQATRVRLTKDCTGMFKLATSNDDLQQIRLKGDYVIDLEHHALEGEWSDVIAVLNCSGHDVIGLRYK